MICIFFLCRKWIHFSVFAKHKNEYFSGLVDRRRVSPCMSCVYITRIYVICDPIQAHELGRQTFF